MRKRSSVIAVVSLSVCLLAGLCLLACGVAGAVRTRRVTAQYQRTQGRYTAARPYSDGGDPPTYQLLYTYTVDGQSYTVATDYGVGAGELPRPGQVRSILYNPLQPAQAVLQGADHSHILVLVGLLFITVPGLFLFFVFLSTPGGSRVPSQAPDILISLVLIVLALGIFYAQAGTLAPRAVFACWNIWMLVPVLFLAVGAGRLIGCLFTLAKKPSSRPR